MERDRYYMEIAFAVRGPENKEAEEKLKEEGKPRRGGANCSGSKIGALLVREDRIIGTGYNGTPSGMLNCNEGGCVRCSDSQIEKGKRKGDMVDPSHKAGYALDRCICVHAEQNALLTAARFGIAMDGATIYTTLSPCFTCLKEAVQAGIHRVVFHKTYDASYPPAVQRQYNQMAGELRKRGSEYAFEPLAFERLTSSQRPGARSFTSWSSQPLPSGSLNEANEP